MDTAYNNTHLFHMKSALDEANKALNTNEVPVGAVVVDGDGEIIGRGCNESEAMGCQTGHAEVLAIQEACKNRGDWRLDDCSIYITLEPCLMCFGLITLSRFRAVYYGAQSPLFGCGIDNKDVFPARKADLVVEGGLYAEESASLLRRFFEGRRLKRETDNGE